MIPWYFGPVMLLAGYYLALGVDRALYGRRR